MSKSTSRRGIGGALRASYIVSLRAALDGTLPAEALPPDAKADLMHFLVRECGWTDREVAVHTRWTDYTVARIRNHLGLQPNRRDPT